MDTSPVTSSCYIVQDVSRRSGTILRSAPQSIMAVPQACLEAPLLTAEINHPRHQAIVCLLVYLLKSHYFIAYGMIPQLL